MKNWEKEFNEIYRRATGEENIVGDLLVKQFIQNLLDKQKEEIKKMIKKMKHLNPEKFDYNSKMMSTGFNKALEDILKELNK